MSRRARSRQAAQNAKRMHTLPKPQAPEVDLWALLEQERKQLNPVGADPERLGNYIQREIDAQIAINRGFLLEKDRRHLTDMLRAVCETDQDFNEISVVGYTVGEPARGGLGGDKADGGDK